MTSFIKLYVNDRMTGTLHAQLLSSQVAGTFQIDSASALGSQLQTMGGTDKAVVTIENEQILCSAWAVSGSTITATIDTRGYNGTSAATHAGAVACEMHFTKAHVDNLQAQMDQTANTDVPNLQAHERDGLVYQSNTTIVSASQHTLAGDYSAVFTVGRVFFFKVSGTWYRSVVRSSVFAAGVTTINITGDALVGAGTVQSCGVEYSPSIYGSLELSLAKYLSADPAQNPPAGKYWVYLKNDGLHIMDSAGTVTNFATTNFANGGDGSDGAATLDGTNTYSFLSKSSNIYTATRDLYLSTLTVNSGKTLKMASFRLFVQGTLTNAGTISNNGNDGADGATGASGGALGAGGAAVAAGSMPGGLAGSDGGNGGNNAAGGNASAGQNSTRAVNATAGAAGGGGGNSGGGNAGGTGGAAGTNTTSVVNAPRNYVSAIHLYDANGTAIAQFAVAPTGGGGGGGGSGAFGHGGGGGGSGSAAGFLFISAKTIINSGTISANGGKGGNGGDGGAGAGCGGGGGGAGGPGGVVMLCYYTLTNSGSITATGGVPGTKGASTSGAGAAVDGTVGQTGVVIQITTP